MTLPYLVIYNSCTSSAESSFCGQCMSHSSSYNVYLLNLQHVTTNHKQQYNFEQMTLASSVSTCTHHSTQRNSKHTGTPQYSVRPLPELPSTPNELLSSSKTRNRYFSFNLRISSKGAIWPEF